MKTNSFLTSILKVSLLLLVLSFSSCEDEEILVLSGTDGFFIINEGSWGNSNTSLSFFDRNTNTISNDIFEMVTGKPLGDQSQSMTVFNEKGYIVVQNSGKVEVINSEDYTSVATISERIISPRYLIGINSEKAYLSDWGTNGINGYVKIIDLSINEVVDSVSTGQGTNQMVKVGDYVYVTNSGGWGYDNTVVVINTNTDEITTTIEVGDNPSSLVIDSEDNVWITGNGNSVYKDDFSLDLESSTPAFIAKINTDNKALVQKLEAKEIGAGPSSIQISSDKQTLVFKYNGGVSTMNTDIDETITSIDATNIITNVANIYGLSIDTFSNQLIIGIAPDFSDNGSIKRYEIDGTFVDEYTVGIAPNGIAQ